MTYEDYKRSKNQISKKNPFKAFINKLLTVAIIIMLVLISSNYFPQVKSFINDKVLKETIDFSTVNKLFNKVTKVFKEEEKTIPVVKTEDEYEEYLDGIKYLHSGEVKVKASGIVTFIGKKDGYNNTVVVQQSDGYYAWYGNIIEDVKLYDYVESDSVIGTSEKEYYYVLLKDDIPVNLLDEN